MTTKCVFLNGKLFFFTRALNQDGVVLHPQRMRVSRESLKELHDNMEKTDDFKQVIGEYCFLRKDGIFHLYTPCQGMIISIEHYPSVYSWVESWREEITLVTQNLSADLWH